MKVPAWMMFGLLLAMLLMDVTTIMVVRSHMLRATEMALDAALVGGVNQSDRGRGRLYIDEGKGYDLAYTYFKSSLQLDSNLENNFLKKTRLRIQFIQNGEKPKVTAEVSTVVTAMTTKILGLEGVPVTVRGNRNYVGKFK